MEHKRYWLKLEKNFLQSRFVKVIKNMPNGKDYIIFYLALMLESIESVGHLRMSELVPYNEDMLASVTDTNVDIVRTAMKIFVELGMVTVLSDGTIFLPEVPAITGKESDSAERVRRFRERKALSDGAKSSDRYIVTKSNDNIEYNKVEKNRVDIHSPAEQDGTAIRTIIGALNSFCNTKYRHTTEKTRRLIRARLKEGFSEEDFWTVIKKKSAQWMGTDMEKFLRPETLFGTKFESYLNEHARENEEARLARIAKAAWEEEKARNKAV